MNVHFICRGNAHRSVMAEAYLKSLNVPNITVTSSGSVADAYRERNVLPFKNTQQFLQDHGLGQYAKKSSDQLTQDRLNADDITICLNRIAYDEGLLVVEFPDNTLVWDVSDTGEGDRLLDPGDEPTRFDEEIYAQIKANVDELILQLTSVDGDDRHE